MAHLDCRIVAMFALALSLILLGSVLLIRHHYHRHNPAKGHHSSSALSVGRDSDSDEDPAAAATNLIAILSPPPPPPPCESNKTSASALQSEFQIGETCLRCLCETLTECKPSTCKGDVMCGHFRISLAYWTDAGRLTLDGRALDIDDDSEKEYLRCVNNQWCAGRTVNGYMKRYSRDCNADGVIDCYDYAAIHYLGPSGCTINDIPSLAYTTLDDCLQRDKESEDTTEA